MSVEISTTSRGLVGGAAHAVRRSIRARPWGLPALAVAAGVYLLLPVLAGGRPRPDGLPWALAPALALVAWTRAAARSEARARAAFGAVAAAAAFGLLGHLVWAWETARPEIGVVPVAMYLFLAPYALLTVAGALCADSRRERRTLPGATADALLVLLAGLAATLRLVVEPMMARSGTDGLAVLAGLHALGLLPVLVAAVLVLRRGGALSPRSAAVFLGATAVFATGAVLMFAGIDPRPLYLGDAFDVIWLAGWLLLAYAAVDARIGPATADSTLAGQWAHDGLRKLIVPGAALFLAAAVIDLAVRQPPAPATVAVLALLGSVLALRTAHAFSIADREAEQRRRLAHTRALLEISHALAGATELDRVLEVISEGTRSIFGTRAAGIELVGEDGRTLQTRTAVGLPPHVVGLRFPVDGSFTGWVVQHGEPRATTDPSEDPYIQPESRDLLGRSPMAAAPIRFRGATVGALFACIRTEPFDADELRLLGAMAEQAAMAIQNARLIEQVTRLSVTDPLTGLANRRQLEREITREVAAARRGRDLVAIIFDLDDFKTYNDSHGHLAGDAVLVAFARALREETRAMNLAARYGGDEFIALLSDTGPAGARAFIERVRTRFAESTAELGAARVTVSAGMAAFAPEMQHPEALLRAADGDLYRTKPRVTT